MQAVGAAGKRSGTEVDSKRDHPEAEEASSPRPRQPTDRTIKIPKDQRMHRRARLRPTGDGGANQREPPPDVEPERACLTEPRKSSPMTRRLHRFRAVITVVQ